MPPSLSVRLLAGLLFLTLLPAIASAGESPTVRGWRTDWTGRYPEAEIPKEWSAKKDAQKNIAWKTPLPAWSNATPVLLGERIFVTAEKTRVLCLGAADGTVLWQDEVGLYDWIEPKLRGPVEEMVKARKKIHSLSAKIAKNPSQLPLYKELGALATELASRPENEQLLDLAHKAALPRTHNTNGYATPTPVTDGERLYVLFGTGVAAAYSLEGERLWTVFVERPDHAWGHSSSPALAGGKLLIHIHNTLSALDPATGKTLWTAKGASSWGTPLPVRIADAWCVLTTGGDLVRVEDGEVLARKLVELPWSSAIVEDGIVYAFDMKGARAVRLPEKAEKGSRPERLWNVKVAKDRYYASPLLHEGLLYNVSRGKKLQVLDAKDGSLVYDRTLELGGGTVYPSPLLAGETILVSIDSGTTILLAPGRKYEELGKNTLEPFRSTPVARGKRLYIRGMRHLWCIGETE